MKINIKIIAAVLCFFMMSDLFVSAQTEERIVMGQTPVYMVSKTTEPVIIDGRMNESSWNNAEICSFDYFFRLRGNLEKQKTKFRMLWDDKNLYLFYQCEDTSLTARETKRDGIPHIDDCVEFFCVPVADSIYFHYGFEVNLYKAAFDFIVLWKYYNDNTIFISGYNPEYSVGVTYDGTINDDTDKDKGWQMEMQIPFTCFNEFYRFAPAKPGVRWAFQAVRQDRNLVSDRFRSTSLLFPVFDLRQDVHQPCHFGLLEFAE